MRDLRFLTPGHSSSKPQDATYSFLRSTGDYSGACVDPRGTEATLIVVGPAAVLDGPRTQTVSWMYPAALKNLQVSCGIGYFF